MGITLEVIKTPGHTPDGICLLDKKNGLLFSGDVIYKGTLLLHLPEANFSDFSNTVIRLDTMTAYIKHIMPAHGDIDLDPSCIRRMVENL